MSSFYGFPISRKSEESLRKKSVMTDDVWEQLRQTYNIACNVDGSNG